MKAKRVWSAVLCAGLALSMCVNAGAAAQNDELRAAASYVSEQGVMVGDQNGDMALDQTLSRTELAVILTRITVNPEHLEAERELYTRKCEFPDVPEWARLYVGYLSFNGLMVGYDDGSFGAADLVTPAAACTVILRHLGYPESSGWDYSTACADQPRSCSERAGGKKRCHQRRYGHSPLPCDAQPRGRLHWSRRCRRGGSRRKYPAGRDREFGFRPPRNHLQYRWLDQYPIGWVPLCSTGWRCDPL